MIGQTWRDLLFAHWPVPLEELAPRVPAPLAVETHSGSAWVSITPFLLTGLRLRGLPPLPRLSRFPELNLRTYVTLDDKPGIWFFSLDAGSKLAVWGARLGYRLPYHEADMTVRREGDWIAYHSRRKDGAAELSIRYRPAGESTIAKVGTLEHFLTERYALYAVTRTGAVLRAEIDHPPWVLHPAAVEIERNTLARAHGIALSDREPLTYFSYAQPTHVWPPLPARARADRVVAQTRSFVRG